MIAHFNITVKNSRQLKLHIYEPEEPYELDIESRCALLNLDFVICLIKQYAMVLMLA